MIKSYNIKKVWNQNLQVLFFIGGVWKLLHNKIYSSKFQSWYGTASYLPLSIDYMDIGSCSKKNMNLSSFIFIHWFLVITLITSLPLIFFLLRLHILCDFVIFSWHECTLVQINLQILVKIFFLYFSCRYELIQMSVNFA